MFIKTPEKRYYILIGDEENWKTAIQENMWGFSDKTKGLWNTIQIGEYIVFYVTQPFSKIIGLGVVTRKFIDEKLLWKDELNFNRSLWKYRLEFKPIIIQNNWEKGFKLPSRKKWFLQSTRIIIEKEMFFEIIEVADKQWKTKIRDKIKKLIYVNSNLLSINFTNLSSKFYQFNMSHSL